MKTKLATGCFITALSAAVVLAVPTNVTASLSSYQPPAQELEGHLLIGGIVKERTENELVVTDLIDESKENRIRLTERTRYFKDGREAKPDDIEPGARVMVRAMQDAEGTPQAVEVTVIRAKVGD
jgi:hypothetical protein